MSGPRLTFWLQKDLVERMKDHVPHSVTLTDAYREILSQGLESDAFDKKILPKLKNSEFLSKILPMGRKDTTGKKHRSLVLEFETWPKREKFRKKMDDGIWKARTQGPENSPRVRIYHLIAAIFLSFVEGELDVRLAA